MCEMGEDVENESRSCNGESIEETLVEKELGESKSKTLVHKEPHNNACVNLVHREPQNNAGVKLVPKVKKQKICSSSEKFD